MTSLKKPESHIHNMKPLGSLAGGGVGGSSIAIP